MKHIPRVTAALVLFFFVAQFIGLLVVNQYIDHKTTREVHEVVYKPLPYNLERPEVENKSISFVYILIAILAGTALLLIIVKTKKTIFWKILFFISVLTTLSVAFSAFINSNIPLVGSINTGFLAFIASSIPLLGFLNNITAGMLALIIAVWKLYKPNIIIQNFSEVFIYGGLAAIFVPMLNLFAAFMMLIAISIYDYIAVYRTKHMVKLAQFQSESKVFAGLFIPYERKQIFSNLKSAKPKIPDKKTEKSVAVLGGGDIGFTLLFAGVVMKDLMLQETVLIGFLKTLIIPIAVSLALLFLLMRGEKDKFYPAMPVLSLGCFIGWLIVWII